MPLLLFISFVLSSFASFAVVDIKFVRENGVFQGILETPNRDKLISRIVIEDRFITLEKSLFEILDSIPSGAKMIYDPMPEHTEISHKEIYGNHEHLMFNEPINAENLADILKEIGFSESTRELILKKFTENNPAPSVIRT